MIRSSFNRGYAIHAQHIAQSVAIAVASFKESCDQCCMTPECMWQDCSRCRVASAHREKLEELRSKSREVMA
jgi:hypothetical protein